MTTGSSVRTLVMAITTSVSRTAPSADDAGDTGMPSDSLMVAQNSSRRSRVRLYAVADWMGRTAHTAASWDLAESPFRRYPPSRLPAAPCGEWQHRWAAPVRICPRFPASMTAMSRRGSPPYSSTRGRPAPIVLNPATPRPPSTATIIVMPTPSAWARSLGRLTPVPMPCSMNPCSTTSIASVMGK